jgi:peroxisomal trans-2-enoyl-CoA reductase
MASSAISSVLRTNLFANKTAIVTGGATGIGNAIVKELLYLGACLTPPSSKLLHMCAGCNVVIAARKFDQLEKEAHALNIRFVAPVGQPARVLPVACNIRKEADVQNLIESTLRTYGGVDYLVNNAGGQFPSPSSDMSLKGWNAVIETNLTGTWMMCREGEF